MWVTHPRGRAPTWRSGSGGLWTGPLPPVDRQTPARTLPGYLVAVLLVTNHIGSTRKGNAFRGVLSTAQNEMKEIALE